MDKNKIADFLKNIRKPIKTHRTEPIYGLKDIIEGTIDNSYVHLECRVNGSNKFYIMRLKGAEIETQYGKIGTAPPSHTKSFKNGLIAQREFDRILDQKLKKGYTVIKKESEITAPAEYRAQASKLLKANVFTDSGMTYRNILLQSAKGDRVGFMQLGQYLYKMVYNKIGTSNVCDPNLSTVIELSGRDEIDEPLLVDSIAQLLMKGYSEVRLVPGSINDGMSIRWADGSFTNTDWPGTVRAISNSLYNDFQTKGAGTPQTDRAILNMAGSTAPLKPLIESIYQHSGFAQTGFISGGHTPLPF